MTEASDRIKRAVLRLLAMNALIRRQPPGQRQAILSAKGDAPCPTCHDSLVVPPPLPHWPSHCSACRLNLSRCDCEREFCRHCVKRKRTTP